MIRVSKPRKTPNLPVFVKKKKIRGTNFIMTAAEYELKKAIEYFENTAKKKKEKFKFSVYNKEEVKDKLLEIFNKKCAYCESRFRESSKGDVEHFRPKSEIKILDGSTLKRGYYWLAATWDNFLLSCTNCNQSGKFRIDENGKKVSMGKGVHFPLSNEKKRVKSRKKNVNSENKYVLLLNPCKTNPLKHLDFADNGTVKSAIQSNGKSSSKGEQSILIYGLHRIELVDARSESNADLSLCLMNLYNGIQDIEEAPNMPSKRRNRVLKSIDKNSEHFLKLMDISAEFLGSKKQKLRRILKKYPAMKQKLLSYGFDLEGMMK